VSHYFISDLHLTPAEPALSRALRRWTDRVAGHARSVFILGDLVDVWLGDDDDSAWSAELVEIFRPLRERQIRCYFMPGNRDFLLGDRYCRAAGWTLLPDPYRLELDGHRLLLTHGDALCTGDHAYQAYRRQVRQAHWQAEVLQRPLADRRRLAGELREASDLESRGKAPAIMDIDPAQAAQWMQEHNVDTLIHGHTHRPGIHQCVAGTRYVLGDWRLSDERVSAQLLRLDHGVFELLTM
jgi:UDP-2,3-diacylglucosamine hydrolase